MKHIMDYGKWLLISVVATLAIHTVVIVLVEWKNLVDPVFTCAVCSEEFWWFPQKVTVLGQEIEICRGCMKLIRELGHQIESLLG